jgi:glycosyltransferase involved in cell wall biosynthesis
MICPDINDLPKPPEGKTGWPWTERSGILKKNADGKNLATISIITPSYNQGQYIEETIRSVLLQSYPSIELIVIDGGSSDETVTVIEKYSKWIKFWVSEKDEGQSSAINKGLQHVTGDIVNWVNSDDVVDKDAFWHLDESFDKKFSFYTGSFKKYCNGVVTETSRLPKYSSIEELLVSPSMAQPSLYYKTEVFKSLNGVNKNFHYCMDLELFKKAVLKEGLQSICYLNSNLSLFRIHGDSKTHKFQIQFAKERYTILYNLLAQIDSSPKRVKAIFDRFRHLLIDNEKWELVTVNQKHLLSLVIDSFLNEYHNSLNWSDIGYLYGFSAKNYPFKRLETYLLPAKMIYRRYRYGQHSHKLVL